MTSDATRAAGWSTWSIATQELADRAWVWITGGAIILLGAGILLVALAAVGVETMRRVIRSDVAATGPRERERSTTGA